MRKSHIAAAGALVLCAGCTCPVMAQELFQPPQQFLTDQQTIGVAVGDINSDGLADVVTGGCGCGFQINSKLYVYLQQPDRTLNAVPVVYTPQGSPGSVSIGDVTGDGRADVVMRSGLGFEVVPQNASGTLDPSILYPSNFAELARIGDLNGDGRLDAIGLEFSIDGHTNAEEAAVLYQNPSGSFDPEVLVPLPHGFNDDVELADINGDGRLDVVVVNQYNEPPIVILYQTENGTLSAPVTLNIAAGVLANHVGVGDMNGDGRKDLVVTFDAFNTPAHFAVFSQNEDGSFAGPAITETSTSLTAIEIADANRDGRDDILLLRTATLGVILQTANGELAPETVINLPSAGGHYQHGFVAADINADGAVDLAYGQGGAQGALTVLYGIATPPPPVNRDPIAVADRTTLRCDDVAVIRVLANDSDPDGDALTVTSVTKPAHGVAKVTADGKRVKYEPQRRFRGTDRFSYAISDGRGGTAMATVTVIVK